MNIAPPAESFPPDTTAAHSVAELPVFPMQGFRDLFDPAPTLHKRSDEEFLTTIAATRRPVVIEGLGRLTGSEIMLVTGLYVAEDARQGELDYARAEPLATIDTDRQLEIIAYTHAYAKKTANLVVEMTQEIQAQQAESVQGSAELLPSAIDVAAMVTAAFAHRYEGFTHKPEKRRSMRDYYMHTDDIARNIHTGWGVPLDDADRSRRDLLKFVGREHDGLEKTFHNSTQDMMLYLSRGLPVASPLVAEEVLLQLGNPKARRVARALRRMTRAKDDLGNRTPYKRYINDGIVDEEAGELWLIPKDTDIYNNWIQEPLPAGNKAIRKASDYRAADAQISRAIARLGDTCLLERSKRLKTNTNEDLRLQREAERGAGIIFRHRIIGAQFHDRFAA